MSDYIIENGILKRYNGAGSDVVIPEGVTCIGEGAFAFCSSLTSVTIPAGVTSIDGGAFCGCSSLMSASIPAGVTSIGDRAFCDCSSLTSASIPAGVTSIGDRVFRNCSSLTSVTIPAGVTSIGKWAFSGCRSLTSVTIPVGVTSIGYSAFEGCRSLTSVAISAGVTSIGGDAFSGCRSLASVTIPDTVTSIGNGAFYGCSRLTSVTIPDTVTSIGYHAFSGCSALEKLVLPEGRLILNQDVFGDKILSPKLRENAPSWIFNMLYVALKQYVFCDEELLKSLNTQMLEEILILHNNKIKSPVFWKLIGNSSEIGEHLLDLLGINPRAAEYNAVALYMQAALNRVSDELLQKLYKKLQGCKSAKKALEMIRSNPELLSRCEPSATATERNTFEKLFANILKKEGKSPSVIESTLQQYYSLTLKSLPVLSDKENNSVSPLAFAWLLLAHEKIGGWDGGVIADYAETGIRPEARTLLDGIDAESFRAAIAKLSEENLGLMGRSKKMYLAYPICRYADAETMRALLARAPRWASSVSGNNAPPLRTFRDACLYSEHREVILFADKYKDLDRYAAIRGTTAELIRDRNLADVGLTADGTKTYDLGNQQVTVRLQKDLSFIVELANGKTAKSLPKKGADPALYETANADFSSMKKNAKLIVKNRITALFTDFLDGHGRKAKDWIAAYTENPILRTVASLLVWEQGGVTFTVSDTGIVKSDGGAYVITEGDIALAHPMEMGAKDLTAWQKYFTSNAIKQPFLQIWEPVIPADSIAKDRYKGCMIPYYRFTNQDKHGIHVADFDFHEVISITFDDCNAKIERIDRGYHQIDPNDRFEIREFNVRKYTRRINHITAYLDRITVYGRILNDDVSVRENLGTFTLAQIMDFIQLASENNCTNVTALLLEYKNENFSDFDPMDEFVLD